MKREDVVRLRITTRIRPWNDRLRLAWSVLRGVSFTLAIHAGEISINVRLVAAPDGE